MEISETEAIQVYQLIEKYKSDLPLYASSVLKLVDDRGQVLDFEFNSLQTELHEIIEKQKRETGRVRVIVLKSRRLGISTYVASRFMWKTLLNKNLRAVVVTHMGSSTNALFRIYKGFLRRLPDVFKPSLKSNNSKEMEFEGIESTIVVTTAGSSETGRGDTMQLAHLSEMGLWENADDVSAGLMSAITNSDGTEIIIESTAKGVGTLFHRMWTNAVLGKNDYIPVFLNWTRDNKCRSTPPDNFVPSSEELVIATRWNLDNSQLWWRRSSIADKGEEKFLQEYPLTAAEAFRMSITNSFIDPDIVIAARGRILEKNPNIPLVIGVDAARGGADSTCIVWRRGRIVEKYELINKAKGPEIANRIVEIIKKDSPAAINIDGSGGWGAPIVDCLSMLGYDSNEINFSSKPYNEKYFNRRAEMYGLLRDWLEDECSIPDCDMLEEELVSFGFKHKGERILLESKEDVKKRIKRSPDIADALCLTFAIPINELVTNTKSGAWSKILNRTADYAW